MYGFSHQSRQHCLPEPAELAAGSAPVAVVIYEVLMGSVAKDFW
ncbi:uncharacterized protein An07g05470 [Aspergillus niger]|uniref:Contig An07c0130, genomic contig n=2 Tax=Aspergillus niger TaxID=5061 RepID=A2QNF4_ASPNC|nr:uncharacterized protein An07g05470 [Aspergillus niger]CAK39463.1 unnamed protein product [Aspergillus niger]